jgi:predicted transcriptional regulator
MSVELMEYRALVRSELKQKIFLSLLEKNKKLSELEDDVKSSETTILHVLKEFENLGLTKKNAGVYSLSSLGLMEAQICHELFRATEVLEKFRDFWLSHDVKPIPSDLMLKIGALQDSNFLRAESTELGKIHETYTQIMLSSKRVNGLSPIFHPDFVSIFKTLLTQGSSIELVLTDQVLNRTLEHAIASGNIELFQKFMVEGLLKIYLIDDLKIALTVTDNIFSMGLFDLNGQYDYDSDLISLHPEALEWGEEIFRHYSKQSRKVEL